MITSTSCVDLGSSAKLTQCQNEGCVEHAAFVEIVNERGDGLVPGRQTRPTFRINVDVVIPATLVDRRERNAGLHETPGKQASLPERIPDVGVANCV